MECKSMAEFCADARMVTVEQVRRYGKVSWRARCVSTGITGPVFETAEHVRRVLSERGFSVQGG